MKSGPWGRAAGRNKEITEQACRKCHQEIVEAIEGPHATEPSCVRCHSTVGHLR